MSKLKFSNVLILNDKEFMLRLNGQELVDMWTSQKIKYDPEIQRGLKLVKNEEGKEIYVPIYSKLHVRKIKEAIENNDFYVSQITLNIKEGVGSVKYNEKDLKLDLEDCEIAILDGQHRLRALECIHEGNENGTYEKPIDLTQINFPIKISNYSTLKGQQQFYQFTLGSKISSSRIEYFNNKDYANKITKELYNNSVLKGKIEDIKNIVGKNEEHKVVSYSTLKKAIEMNFKTDTFVSDSETSEITSFLKKFFDELFKVIPSFNSFEERKELREEGSMLCENFAFYGYLSVASHLINKSDWKDHLVYLKEIEFRKNQAPWVNRVTKKNVSKKGDKKGKGEITYSIINNSQSRKEMCTLLLREFKKVEELHNNE